MAPPVLLDAEITLQSYSGVGVKCGTGCVLIAARERSGLGKRWSEQAARGSRGTLARPLPTPVAAVAWHNAPLELPQAALTEDSCNGIPRSAGLGTLAPMATAAAQRAGRAGRETKRPARHATSGESALPDRRRPSPAGQAGLARLLRCAPGRRAFEPLRGPLRGTGHALNRPLPSIPDWCRGFPRRPARPVLDPRREHAPLEIRPPVPHRRRSRPAHRLTPPPGTVRGTSTPEQGTRRNPEAWARRGDRGAIPGDEAAAKPRAGAIDQQAANRHPDAEPDPAAEHNHGAAEHERPREEKPTVKEERVAEERIEEKRVEAARAEEKRPEGKRVAEREAETEAPGPAEAVNQTQAHGRGVWVVGAAVIRQWRRGGVVHRVVVDVAAELDRPPAAHKGVVARVEREQHPDAAVGIGAEHDEVAILAELYVHMCLFAAPVIVLIEPDFHRWVATAHGGPGRGGWSGSSEQEQQREKHA